MLNKQLNEIKRERTTGRKHVTAMLKWLRSSAPLEGLTYEPGRGFMA